MGLFYVRNLHPSYFAHNRLYSQNPGLSFSESPGFLLYKNLINSFSTFLSDSCIILPSGKLLPLSQQEAQHGSEPCNVQCHACLPQLAEGHFYIHLKK